MPDAAVVVMKDLRYALGRDTDLGGDLLAMHSVGVRLEHSFYQSRLVGDFVRNRDILLLKASVDGDTLAVEITVKFVDDGTIAEAQGNLPDFVI